jgi:hypothetical protein
MSARIGDWMQTHTGRRYYPGDPRPDDVVIEDIAHALSHLCRFGGHCNRFYSVAEHSVLVSMAVPREHALQGLLHDATEAYCVDIPRPLKRQLSNYAEIEHRNWLAVAERFCLPVEMHASVHAADNDVLLAERDALFDREAAPWSVPGTPAQVGVVGWSPWKARDLFLQRYQELTT